MKHLLSVFFLTFFISSNIFAEDVLTDNKIAEISERLESFSTDKLIERRELLLAQVNNPTENEYEDGCENNIDDDKDGKIDADDSDCDNLLAIAVDSSNTSKLLEISIIEAMLAALGIILIDNISDDTSTPPDTISPVITILGDNPASVEIGDAYVDAGATADGGETVTVSGSVDTSILGSYILTYTATDASGNTGTATRTVNVVDTTPPVITVLGANPAEAEVGNPYGGNAGATATDKSGETITVVESGTVDTTQLGPNTLTYTATDSSGNTSTATRIVNVIDTVPPVITSSDTFVADENQTAIGTVTATDKSGGTITFSISGTELQITSSGVLSFVTAPDYETKSVYTATVTATDASSNSASQDITVNVNDVGGIDDDPGTGTGTGTGTSTGTSTGTGTS